MAAVAWRPRSGRVAAVCAGAAVTEVALGVAPARALSVAVREALPLTAFLTAAIWMASTAQAAWLAGRAAVALTRWARGRRTALYLAVCAACALLTAVVSPDGAVVLIAPVVARLAEALPELRRPFLFGAIGAANASSLALPQANPTNMVLMQRLALSPQAFVGRLFVPAVLATVVCCGGCGPARPPGAARPLRTS